MSNVFVVAAPDGCIRHNIPPVFTVDHVHNADGGLSAVLVQRRPQFVQRLGYTGLIQSPDAHSVDLLSAVYGLYGRIEPADDRPPSPGDEPLPVECPASDYVSEFHSVAVKVATRSLWKVQRQSAHVDSDDIANDAVVLLLDDPSRYALDPIDAGASAAVNDAIRNEQGSEVKRAVKFEPITLDIGLTAPIETIPSDYETDADALAKLVGGALSIHAAMIAHGVENAASASALGLSLATFERRRALVRQRVVQMAIDGLLRGDLR
jgi:hypothetical protein